LPVLVLNAKGVPGNLLVIHEVDLGAVASSHDELRTVLSCA
jgi:hypothetical protein